MTSQPSGSTEHLVKLTLIALDDFDEVPLATSARRALRIARLRGDADIAWMLAQDLRPGRGSSIIRRSEAQLLWPELDPAAVHERHRGLAEVWIQERQPHVPELLPMDPKDTILVGSIAEVEARIESWRRDCNTETDFRRRAVAEARLGMELEVLERIRFRVYSYLCQCERVLGFATGASSVFDRYRARVDAHLEKLAPEVLEQLTAAYRRTKEGDAEALSHALTSCRRMLKSVADIVFPAQDKPFIGRDGKERAVGPDQYLARLWAFIDKQ